MPKPPVFFSRAGSDLEWSSPVVGSAASKVGTPTYSAGVFGNGIDTATGISSAGHQEISVDVDGVGTIEFSVIPSFAHNDGVRHDWMYDWHFNSGYEFYKTTTNRIAIFITNQSAVPYISYEFTLNSFASGDKVHFGIVVDRSASAGNKCAVWQNNVALTLATSTDGSGGDYGTGPFWFSFGKIPIANTSVVDNIKIYDYKRTEFADYRDERSGMNDQVIIS